MSKYVDLSERVTASYYDEENEEWTQKTVTVADILDSVCDDYTVLPSIDAVPVVRYKDCKHRPERLEEGKGEGFNLEFPDDTFKCPCRCDDGWYNWMPDDNWFCGNGERKEE